MAQSGKAALDRGCGVGAVVTLKVDYRTHSHVPGLLGVVYAFKAESGGILVCCEHGIITHDGSKSQYWVPVDKYTVVANKDTYVPISKELQAIRDMVLTGTFDTMKNQKCISFSKYVDRELQSTSPVKRMKGCGCKKKCTRSCGCKKKGFSCHSGCVCNGNCD